MPARRRPRGCVKRRRHGSCRPHVLDPGASWALLPPGRPCIQEVSAELRAGCWPPPPAHSRPCRSCPSCLPSRASLFGCPLRERGAAPLGLLTARLEVGQPPLAGTQGEGGRRGRAPAGPAAPARLAVRALSSPRTTCPGGAWGTARGSQGCRVATKARLRVPTTGTSQANARWSPLSVGPLPCPSVCTTVPLKSFMYFRAVNVPRWTCSKDAF